MKFKIIYKLSLILFMITFKLQAFDRNDLMHVTAHFGGTYAGTHITEVICKKTSNQSKLICTLEAIALANALNVAYKAQESFPNDTKRALIAGAAGSTTAGLFITIDW